jgi:hypothetical protein
MTPATAPTATDLAARDQKYVLHPYLGDDVGERVVIVSGEGCRLTDSTSRSYLDATGGLWLAQVGHGRAELANIPAAQSPDARVLHQLRRAQQWALDQARRAPGRSRAELDRAGVLHQRRLRGRRHGDQDRAPVLPPPRAARPQLDPVSPQRLSRSRVRRGLGDRIRGIPRRIRAALAEHPSPHAGLAVTLRAIRGSRPDRFPDQRARGHDRAARERKDRCADRRAGDGSRRARWSRPPTTGPVCRRSCAATGFC